MSEVRIEHCKGNLSIVTPLTVRSDFQHIIAETSINLPPIEQSQVALFKLLAGQTLSMRMFDLGSIWLQINASRLKKAIEIALTQLTSIDEKHALEHPDFIRIIQRAESHDYEVKISVLYVQEPISDLQERLKSISIPCSHRA